MKESGKTDVMKSPACRGRDGAWGGGGGGGGGGCEWAMSCVFTIEDAVGHSATGGDRESFCVICKGFAVRTGTLS